MSISQLCLHDAKAEGMYCVDDSSFNASRKPRLGIVKSDRVADLLQATLRTSDTKF